MVGFERTFASLTDESAHGTRKLGTAVLKRFPVGLPPIPEQRAIANYLDRETAGIDRLLQKIERAVERLTEYRFGLITAAVSGKVDLREAISRTEPAMLVAAS